MDFGFEIIDFHTHPFIKSESNICSYKDYIQNVTAEDTATDLKNLGISKICGSVISPFDKASYDWNSMKKLNDIALELRDTYGDFYIPGFHVHPSYVRESCEEIEAMHKKGVKLIGELVPYWHGWSEYGSKEMSEILDTAEQYDMILNIHTMDEEGISTILKNHPNLIVVAAHPGERPMFDRHLERMKLSNNYYLDLSGTGVFRHASLRNAIDTVGVEKFIFGTDYPTCNPGMLLGGVILDYTITDEEKEYVLSKNAKRILGIN